MAKDFIMRMHHEYLVKGQSMYYLAYDSKEDCLIWYYYIGSEILYFRDKDLKWSEIEEVEGPLIRKLSTRNVTNAQVIHI
jgi:hypothetical protein